MSNPASGHLSFISAVHGGTGSRGEPSSCEALGASPPPLFSPLDGLFNPFQGFLDLQIPLLQARDAFTLRGVDEDLGAHNGG